MPGVEIRSGTVDAEHDREVGATDVEHTCGEGATDAERVGPERVVRGPGVVVGGKSVCDRSHAAGASPPRRRRGERVVGLRTCACVGRMSRSAGKRVSVS
jgi:hypothetical protein